MRYVPELVALVFAAFGIFAWLLSSRLRLAAVRGEIEDETGSDAIAVRKSPKVGGYMALYDEFLVHRANGFAPVVRVPYAVITRLGVEEYRGLPRPHADICVEYRDCGGREHLALFVCTEPEEFVTALRERIDHAKKG